MKKIVFKNPDGSLAVTTLANGIDIVQERVKILAHNPDFTYVADVAEKDFPNAAQPEVLDVDEVTVLEFAQPEAIVEDYVIENGLPIKKPVADNLRHLRNSWRWNGLKVIESASIVKTMRAENVRVVRDQLLTESDVDEFRLSGQALADAQTYRTALRDLGTDIDLDPENVTFPVRP